MGKSDGNYHQSGHFKGRKMSELSWAREFKRKLMGVEEAKHRLLVSDIRHVNFLQEIDMHASSIYMYVIYR